eukprot:m.253733 g.253733  ORF g.253733 m.253733 type:complete len:254 (+) comp19593_c0_seq2:2216-2977(+)
MGKFTRTTHAHLCTSELSHLPSAFSPGMLPFRPMQSDTRVDRACQCPGVCTETHFGDYITLLAPVDLSAAAMDEARDAYGVTLRTYQNRNVLAAHVGVDGVLPTLFALNAAALSQHTRVNASVVDTDPQVRGAWVHAMEAVRGAVRAAVEQASAFDHHRDMDGNGATPDAYDTWVVASTRERFTAILHRLADHIDQTLSSMDHSGQGQPTATDAHRSTSADSDSIVRHMHDSHVLLDSDLAIREALYHVHVTL